ncbi:hypothetical protein J7E63_05495 [Bacillus sp. ISL-75]|uniref:hypothetical protein n=1 Tax=Bacillus sp. ISL-75 TaxID=2819137 RepID=UPI001BE7E932|nr:hypothetical protein [Bacillus sp. ISL-75]MBT2726393.1 hypothetical protein [Bacillus sp. ISL-75]
MKWAIVFAFSIVLALMFLYEWPKIKSKEKKEKIVFVCLLAMGWVLSFILLFYPDTPGPTNLVDSIYKPLGKLLE